MFNVVACDEAESAVLISGYKELESSFRTTAWGIQNDQSKRDGEAMTHLPSACMFYSSFYLEKVSYVFSIFLWQYINMPNIENIH